MYQKLVLFLFISLIPIASHASGDIPMVGLDDNGNPVEVTIAGRDYSEQVQSIISTVNDSALPALVAHDLAAPKWSLRTIMVGIGLGVEAGIGPLIKVKASPRFRLAFSNSTDPALP